MWDVKVFNIDFKIGVKGSFISTMWDVKAELNNMLDEEPKPFYLDYVGCKEFGRIAIKSINTRFYLDYVGCKGYYGNGQGYIYKSFISTMWDVKIGLVTLAIGGVIGFISTMWDVKLTAKSKELSEAMSFISTMWDVK